MCVSPSPSLISARNGGTRVHSHELFFPGNIALFESDNYGNFSITTVLEPPLEAQETRAQHVVNKFVFNTDTHKSLRSGLG